MVHQPDHNHLRHRCIMAKKHFTEIDTEEFDHWLSELFIVTESMGYVLNLMPDEHTVLSNTLAMFQSRLSDLLIEGHEYWIGTDIAFPIQKLTAVAQQRGGRYAHRRKDGALDVRKPRIRHN